MDKVSLRNCGQISKQRRAIKNAVNAGQWSNVTDSEHPSSITFEECVSNESSLWRDQENVESNEVPKLVKRHLVDLFHLQKKVCRRGFDATRGNGQLYRIFSSILQELKSWFDTLTRDDTDNEKRGLKALLSKRICGLTFFTDSLKQQLVDHQAKKDVIELDEPYEELTEEVIDEYYSVLNMDSIEGEEFDDNHNDAKGYNEEKQNE